MVGRYDNAIVYGNLTADCLKEFIPCFLECQLKLITFPFQIFRKTAIAVSGLDWDIIVPCTRWMEPFFQIICEEAQQLFLLESNDQMKVSYGLQYVCPNLVTDDSHILQTHSISLTMFVSIFFFNLPKKFIF